MSPFELMLEYPPCTKVRLIEMKDSILLPPGYVGVVEGIDDLGNLLVNWNGRVIPLIPGIDRWEKVDFQEPVGLYFEED